MACLKSKTNALMDKSCDDGWCEVNGLWAMVESAKRHATEDKFSEAQDIIEYIADKCNDNC